MWQLLQELGRVSRRLIWDNESGIDRGKRHAEGLGHSPGRWPPRCSGSRLRPGVQGVVERRNGFFATSFMPERGLASPAEFTTQFTGWLTIANARARCTHQGPADGPAEG